MQSAETVVRPADVVAEQRREVIETTLDEIAADARRDPDAYLRDTRVPEGGE